MADLITLHVNGQRASVPAGVSVAAAIALTAATAPALTRRAVGGQLRGPVCGMGICQECRVTIDGRPHMLACQTLCQPGMHVETCA
jgi:aerobic-type carbon monoxide dehydrogenase small subunit (CoxS/CutS family)